jgi:cytochrome c
MDSFEWNKIIGAVLGTSLFVVALHIVVSGLLAPHKAEKPGMEVAVTETTAPTGEAPAAEVPPDWGTVLSAADVAAGEVVRQRCLQCHDFAKGGPRKIGPNLWGIVGAKHAHMEGFSYSPAMKALADKTWDYDALNTFLKSPKAEVPGTSMSFIGLSKEPDRINLIAHLRTLSDSPFPIPPPRPPAAEEPAPSTDGGTGEPAGELQAPPPGTTPEGGAPPPAPGAAAPTSPAPQPAAPGSAPSPTPAQPAPTTGSGGH